MFYIICSPVFKKIIKENNLKNLLNLMLTQAGYDDIIHLALLNTAKNKICDGGGIGIRARLRGVSARVWVQVPSIAPNLR